MPKHNIFILITLLLLLISCSKDLPIIENLSETNYKLLSQDSVIVNFPDLYTGKIVVMGFIFTNCPDICPLTTNNMRIIQEKAKGDELSDLEFVALSFDPETDSPYVLTNYIRIRNLDTSNWTFLTGDKNIIKSLLKEAQVFAMPSDSSTTSSGKKHYYYIHTDRISLIDTEGRIRKNYSGSNINTDEIIHDIKLLN
mgnify:CR=1 FL=1